MDRLDARVNRVRKRRASLVAALAASFGAAVLLGAGGATTQRVAFSHLKLGGDTKAHVSRYWKDRGQAEVDRDCRGCHAHTGTSAHDPQAVCKSCHYTEAAKAQVEYAAGRERTFAREADRAFDHVDHDDLACRACHYPGKEEEKADLVGERGTGTCIRCHDAAEPAPTPEVRAGVKLDPKKRRAGFLERLNSAPRMARPARGPFRHDDHLRDPARTGPEACQECHAGIETATGAELSTKSFSKASCGRCHVDDARRGLAVEGVVETRASVACLTFDHADHLRAQPGANAAESATAAALEATRRDRCAACHAWTAGAEPEPTFALRPDRAGYAGCTSCHAVPRFRTKEHGNWERCTSCHTFGAGAASGPDAMRTNRPVAAVERPPSRSTLFRVPSQRHPGLTGTPAKECLDCHRAPLPETPSRIRGIAFDHAAHLAVASDAQRCDTCHRAAMGAAKRSADLGRAAGVSAASMRASWTIDACQSCHLGIETIGDGRPFESRTVVEFSHEAHLARAKGSDGKPEACVTCHAVDADAAGKSATTLPKALDCTLCHAHDEARAPRTGNHSGTDVTSCAVCHDQGVPAVGSKPTFELLAARVSGGQFHPTDGKCAECHSAARVEPLEPVDVAWLEVPDRFEIHANGKPEACAQCHWAAPDERPGTGYDSTDKVRGLRASKGNELPGFPGVEGAK